MKKNLLRRLHLIPIQGVTEPRYDVHDKYWVTYYNCLVFDRNYNPMAFDLPDEAQEAAKEMGDDVEIQHFPHVSYVPPKENTKCSRGRSNRSGRA